LLGWAALSGLLAWTFADYASRLLDPMFPALNLRLPILLTLMAVSTVQRGLGARPLWRLAVRLAGLAALVLLLAVLVVFTSGRSGEVPVPGTRNLFVAVAALSGLGWLLEVLVDRGGERTYRPFRQGITLTGLSLLVISLPLAFLLWRSVEKGRTEEQTRQVLEEQMLDWGAVKIADLEIRHQLQEVEVLGTLYSQSPITEDQLARLQQELDAELRPDVSLRLIVIPTEVLESGPP